MSLASKLRSFNTQFSVWNLVFLGFALSMICYCPTLNAISFPGPADLKAQEFNELIINGASKLNQIKADSLIVKGPLDFKEIKISGGTEISGACSGEDGEFGNLVIHDTFWGSNIKIENLNVDKDVTIENFKISGDVNINGPLKAKNGSFNNIHAVNTPVALYNVTVNNITVKKAIDKGAVPNTNANNTASSNEIKLAGNTIVSGNITFESGDGLVFIRDKTAALKGKVIGGTIKE